LIGQVALANGFYMAFVHIRSIIGIHSDNRRR